MRITTMLTILAASAGIAAQAETPGETMAVYLQNRATVQPRILYPAQALASHMFANIGIHLQWRDGKMPAGGSGRMIEILFDTNTPATLKPGALAYALPFEGVHIHVFYDRVQLVGESTPTWLLAHVLVHEITHILQGVVRHSPDGVMKARWTPSEIAGMRRKPLPFTPEDVDFIRTGLAAREARPAEGAMLASAAVTAQ